jgi:glycosidase
MRKNITLQILIIIFSFATIFIAQQLQKRSDWYKQAVWYQIFPERFFNGNTLNDPMPVDIYEERPFIISSDWKIHPWNSDWYQLQDWELKYNVPFYWATSLRRYGGDLHGVIQKLDYLQDLGITSIYLNPIFESQSHHKYNAAMYHHIDNNFGTNPEKDREIWQTENPADNTMWKWTSADSVFLNLIKECHKRNMKIIIDGVFNHVGKNFWAFEDVVKNQEKSKFAEWFTIKKFDDTTTAENEFDYQGWYGINDLPEFYEDENGFREDVKKHFHDVVKRWMDPNNDRNPEDGIDGWRLDVAEMVNINFWKEFRSWVKEINPESYITGEVWWQDWKNNKMFNAEKWLDGESFDGVMNYRFARAVKEFFINEKNKISSVAFADTLKNIYTDYSFEQCLSLQNLLDSHDVDRISSQLNNPDIWYDHDGNPEQNKNYNIENIDEKKKARLKLIVAAQMTLPGSPMIYYGDEAGMWGGDDPDCRKPMIWRDVNYEPETHHPFGKKRNASVVKFDEDLFQWYKKLISVRKENHVLSVGDIEFIPSDSNTLIYKRFLDSDTIYVIINNADSPKSINLSRLNIRSAKLCFDIITNQKIEDKIELNSYSALIIKEK